MQKLPKNWQQAYQISRIFLVITFLFAGIYLSYKVLLSSQDFNFSFDNPESNKNNLKNFQRSNDAITLFASSINDFSEAKIFFENKNFQEKNNEIGSASINKSYQAFFYPQGEDFTKEISASNLNPDNGRLVSSQETVYIIHENQKLPIDSPTTFEAFGYKWSDVVPFDEESLSKYEKGSLININDVHPDGTIFYTTDTNKYFYISKGQKREIKGSKEIIDSYLKNKSSVSVIESAITNGQSCSLSDDIIFERYNCQISIEDFVNYPGKDYRIYLDLEKQTQPEQVRIQLGEKITWNNIRNSLSKIKNRIILKYLTRR
ncbi:MAG: hypothetical protein UR69_C0003G0132 [Candidatus Moranbacteria bacterium GW2011_GWE2_35_2-]|nr:MAG: hypothetical protein UR69_C0003G0132 [Candidatus Moranbacteria bacterium GW2011_GWE2_35_2-]KKQ06152.1 MAG: hypothetical protein US15_C0017G0004 [Candidatus Moranbacteria bacterium GW2011_GWF1_36_4]KKQ21976.1 MAG: hypothetical protein US37_C0005G0018 [Candidatus Moranbacteria bacterium GW2011_GWF2_37_11]KKQ29097.1 MAG: hypothetical protein US44_C0003G0009 [Candidatus Moranbacteria bacterium GW2011_GWD1_37_17]KKQ31082.1 MAG: hypothetical protein US47_C0001G0315 [Candidatus Moranbacteria b